MGTANFEALYQQSPILMGGDIIKGDWFKRFQVPPPTTNIDLFLDTAMKTGERNDYSVILVTSKINKELYVLEVVRGKWPSYELKQKVIDVYNKYALKVRNVYIEDKASGTGLIQELKKDAKLPIKGVQVTKDKYTRLQDVLGFIESGYVNLPLQASWVSDFISECESFRADMGHAHDDQVDTLTMAIDKTLVRRVSMWDVPL